MGPLFHAAHIYEWVGFSLDFQTHDRTRSSFPQAHHCCSELLATPVSHKMRCLFDLVGDTWLLSGLSMCAKKIEWKGTF